MHSVWRAEIVVEPALAHELIAAQFPEIRPTSIRPLGAGWDNTAYLINDTLVFRFPRRQIAVPLIATEIQLLPWLAPQLPIPIPVPVYAGQPSEKYRWPFAGYVAIGGRSLPSARLSEDERRALTKPLARFLSALHGVNAAAALEGGAPLDVFDRLNTSTRRVRTSECLRGIVNAGVGVDAFRIEAILDTAPAYDPRAETLVHGDLHSAQILVDESNHLAGVIDWGDVHVGDPAVDLAAIHAILPRECHDAFIDMYGVVTDDAWAVARARALWHTTMVLAQAVDTKDDDLAHEAENTLARLVGDRSALSA